MIAIYDAIRDMYGGQQLPAGDSSVFFGFFGCTRSNLERMLNVLRSSWNRWAYASESEQKQIFKDLSTQVAQATGAAQEGLYKFCFWVSSASEKDHDIKSWLSGGDFSSLDYWLKSAGGFISDTAQNVKETVEYGINYESPAEKTFFSAVLPVAGILGVCYLVKKVLD